jgi:hypothetical protein
MAQTKPILQLKADCVPTNFITIRITQTYADGRTVKRDVPAMEGSSMEAALYCIQEYIKILDELNFDTGDELFNNFRQILQGAAQDDWNLVIANFPNRTPALFLIALEQWKTEMILPTTRETLVNYLETLTKPRSMTVEGFVN